MRNSVFALIGIGSALLLAGCTSGTTYGTGKTHEAQTAEGLYNIFALKTEKANIDYSARPDLVMPASKAALPQPSSSENATVNPDWPETPEQRIARLREAAPKADERSGELPLEFMTRKSKEGIKVSRSISQTGYSDYSPRNNDLSTNPNDKDVSEEVKRRREQLAYSKSNTRKYLTEPPSEYRTPSENAVAGDLGVTPEEIKKRKAEARKRLLDEQSPG